MAIVVGNNMGVSNSYQNSTSKAGGYKNVREYSNYLMGKYSCLKPGNNVAVSVTSGLLRKAMSDEKTGQWLERELSKAPDYIKQTQQSLSARGSRLISCSIEFGEEYTTMCVCGVTDTATFFPGVRQLYLPIKYCEYSLTLVYPLALLALFK